MDYNSPNLNQRPVWLLVRPHKGKQKQRPTLLINSAPPHQAALNSNLFLRTPNINDIFYQHITNHRQFFRNDCIFCHENINRNEINAGISNDNGKYHTGPRRSESLNRQRTSRNKTVSRVAPPLESSSGQTKKRGKSNPKSHYSNYELIPRGSHSYQTHKKSLEIESLWSDIEDMVFSDESDNYDAVNSYAFDKFNQEDRASLVSNNMTESITSHRNKSTTSDAPIKGILKSGSQSSYSSFSNDIGSDREAQTSNNSQQSSESSSSLGVVSKTLSKKKVHFEERVITKTIFPFSAFACSNSHVLGDNPQLLAMVDDVIATHPNDTFINNKHVVHSNKSKNSDRARDFYFGNCSGNQNETKRDVVDDNKLHCGTGFDQISNDFKTDKCENEMTFPVHDVYLGEALPKGDNSSLYSQIRFACRVDDIDDSTSRNRNTQIDKKNSLNEEGTFPDEEVTTAFPHRPISTSSSVNLETAKETETGVGEGSNCDYDWCPSSVNNDIIDYPRTKILQGRNLSPEEKTIRILDWLDGLKPNDRHGTDDHSHSHSAGTGRVSVMVIPRPTLRRHSFVGD